MPRISDRQRALRSLSEAIDTFFLLDLIDDDDQHLDVLEALVLCRMTIEGQRYVERPLRYGLSA
jgi:hypothetical protein